MGNLLTFVEFQASQSRIFGYFKKVSRISEFFEKVPPSFADESQMSLEFSRSAEVLPCPNMNLTTSHYEKYHIRCRRRRGES